MAPLGGCENERWRADVGSGMVWCILAPDLCKTRLFIPVHPPVISSVVCLTCTWLIRVGRASGLSGLSGPDYDHANAGWRRGIDFSILPTNNNSAIEASLTTPWPHPSRPLAPDPDAPEGQAETWTFPHHLPAVPPPDHHHARRRHRRVGEWRVEMGGKPY